MTEREVTDTLMEYDNLFGTIPITVWAASKAERQAIAEACRAAITRNSPLTVDELRSLEPKLGEGVLL